MSIKIMCILGFFDLLENFEIIYCIKYSQQSDCVANSGNLAKTVRTKVNLTSLFWSVFFVPVAISYPLHPKMSLSNMVGLLFSR